MIERRKIERPIILEGISCTLSIDEHSLYRMNTRGVNEDRILEVIYRFEDEILDLRLNERSKFSLESNNTSVVLTVGYVDHEVYVYIITVYPISTIKEKENIK